MLNGIWMAMIVLAFVGAVCTGRWTALSAAAARDRSAEHSHGAYAAHLTAPAFGQRLGVVCYGALQRIRCGQCNIPIGGNFIVFDGNDVLRGRGIFFGSGV